MLNLEVGFLLYFQLFCAFQNVHHKKKKLEENACSKKLETKQNRNHLCRSYEAELRNKTPGRTAWFRSSRPEPDPAIAAGLRSCLCPRVCPSPSLPAVLSHISCRLKSSPVRVDKLCCSDLKLSERLYLNQNSLFPVNYFNNTIQ